MRVVLPTAKSLIGRPSIGLALVGCKNRPVYRICVFPSRTLGRPHIGSIIEELGVFDPLPNFRNEKLVAANIERVKYWIGEKDAHISTPVLELLGIWGVLPIHPKTYIRARHNREEREKKEDELASKEVVSTEPATAVSVAEQEIAESTASEGGAKTLESTVASEAETVKAQLTEDKPAASAEVTDAVVDESKVKASKSDSQEFDEQGSEAVKKPAALSKNRVETVEEKIADSKHKLTEKIRNQKIQKEFNDAKEKL